MTTAKKLLIVLPFLLFAQLLRAQNIGINGTGAAPDPSAMLDVEASDKGVLIPRMTASQKTAIAGPAEGLVVYQTDGEDGFWYYDGVQWVRLSIGGEAWELDGNAGTNPGTDYIGTSDAIDWVIKTDATERARFTSAGRIGVGLVNPNNTFDLEEPAAIGGTDAGQFELAGGSGGVLDAVSSDPGNGYNAFEAVHEGTGSSVFAIQNNGDAGTIALQAQTAAWNDRWGLYSVDEVLALDYFVISDRDLKSEIRDIEKVSPLLARIEPVSYRWKEGNPLGARSDTRKYGFLAEQVDTVFSGLVARNSVLEKHEGKADKNSEDTEYGYASVNYRGFIPILTRAFQEQRSRIREQEERLEVMRRKNIHLEQGLKSLREKNQELEERLEELEEKIGS